MIYVPYLKRSLSGELYLRFEGNFNDSSLAARTVTNNGASRSTDHPGGGAEALEGNGSGYLTVVDDGAFDIGGRIFQIRFHLYIESTAALNTPDNIVIGKWGAVDGSWFINIYAAAGLANQALLNLGRRSSGSYFFGSWSPAFLPTDTLMQVTVWRPFVNGDVYMAIDQPRQNGIGAYAVTRKLNRDAVGDGDHRRFGRRIILIARRAKESA